MKLKMRDNYTMRNLKTYTKELSNPELLERWR